MFFIQKSVDSAERSRIRGLMRMLLKTDQLLASFTPTDRHLRLWLDFTGDLHRVRRVFEHGILFEYPGPVQQEGAPSLLANLEPSDAKGPHSMEQALLLIGEALRPLPGSKSLVLLGYGFEPLNVEVREVLQAARTSVFSLDVTNADYHSLEVGLKQVAADTGGFFARTHMFAHRLKVTLNDTEGRVFAKRAFRDNVR